MTHSSPLWSPDIAGLAPYTPGEQPHIANLVKLNTNENAFAPSPGVVAAITDTAAQGLQLYPDPESTALRQTIARYHALQPEQVFVGNGSDEILAHTFAALLRHDNPLWLPDISYSFYPVYCNLYGVQSRTIALDTDYRIRVADYLPRNGTQAGGILIANPNAPTGCALALDDLRTLVAGNPQCVVVIDEAYVDFGAESAVTLINDFPNLLVIQTLSKSRALAGLRVGFALGQAPLIEGLQRVKNSFNSYPLDRLAQAGAVAALEDEAYFQQHRRLIIENRHWLTAALTEMDFDVLPSQANFIFARHPGQDAADLAAALRDKHILVRHFNQPRIGQYLRITIGTREQCHTLAQACAAILGQP